MGGKTKIEWTDATWNPVTGCAKVSVGCKHCYAERDWSRMSKLVPAYAGRDFTDVRTHADRLDQPLRWRRPRRIFVNSMSDLFHPDVSDEFIALVFKTMRDAPQHTFQVLTKRAERMRDFATVRYPMPLPNVWLGVSVEDQTAADERIPLLLNTPAAVRWISAEPLLGLVNLRAVWWAKSERGFIDATTGLANYDGQPSGERWSGNLPPLDWVVVGGESGPKARPMHPAWVRSLRDQCSAAGVSFLFKQWGEWGNDGRIPQLVSIHEKSYFLTLEGTKYVGASQSCPKGTAAMIRVGKKAAGRLLDGVQHDGYPGDEE